MRHAGALWAGPRRRARANGFRPGSSCRATKRSTADSVDDDRRTLAGPRCACLENGMVLAVRGIFVNESNGRRPMKNVTFACLVLCAVVAAVAPSSASAQGTPPSLVKELVATWQRAATEIIDVAAAMPEEKYAYKPTPEIQTFGDQLVHVAGITQRFIDSAKGTKSEAAHPHKMTKAEVIALLK